jgi:hypothetical protein
MAEQSAADPEIESPNPEAVFLVVCDPSVNEL